MNSTKWKKLNELFDAAREFDGIEQDEYVYRACGDDEQLRREVQGLLSASRKAAHQSFLTGDLFTAGIRALPSDKYSAPNTRIGKYRLVRELGRGGMGTVFLAERVDFRQQVALKIIKQGMDTEEVIRRFERERQVLAGLNHPNIARLLDGGETESGLPYLVMEPVHGSRITEFCDRQKLSIEERLRLFLNVCAAVAYAHEHFVVHRDLKPSNILVTKDGTVKLLDFGISKLLASDDSETTIEQTRGIKFMTPEYASPEQILGEQITPASDIYSLGVLLYELLCGHRPFRSDNVSQAELLRIILQQEPTAPSTAALRSMQTVPAQVNETLHIQTIATCRRERPDGLHRRLRGDLDNIALRALRKEPAQRYESVGHLAEDIRRHLTGLPIIARPLTVKYRVEKFVRRNRMHVAVTAILALLLILTVAGWSYSLWRSQREVRDVRSIPGTVVIEAPRKLAVLPSKVTGRDEQDTAYGTDLTETLISRLGTIPELEVRPAGAVAAFAGHDPLATGKRLQVEAVLESTVNIIGDRINISSRLLKIEDGKVLWSGSFDESLADVSKAQNAIAEHVAGTVLGQLTVEQRKKVKKHYTDNPQAYRFYVMGRYAVSQRNELSLRQSLQNFNQALYLDPGYALAYAGIADTYFGLSGLYITANEAFPKMKAAALRALELDSELAEAHVALAMVLSSYEWNWGVADAEFERAIKLNPNYASAYHWYGRHLAFQGRRAEAIAKFQRARELDPLSPYIALDSNFPDFFEGDYDKAIEQINKAIQLDERFWFAWWMRGWAYEGKGNYAAAVADYRKAQSIEDSPTIQGFLGHAYAVMGRRGEARRILNHLLELRKQRYVSAASIVSIYAGLGEREKTFAWLTELNEERDEWLIWLKYDHRYSALRNDPRFQSLLLRVGLPFVRSDRPKYSPADRSRNGRLKYIDSALDQA